MDYVEELNCVILTDKNLKDEILNKELRKNNENIVLKKIVDSYKFEFLNNKPNSDKLHDKYFSKVIKYIDGAKKLRKIDTVQTNRSACLYIRLAIEELLKSLCRKYNISIIDKNAQKLNDLLKNNAIITKTQWKFLYAYLGLGNDAAHTNDENIFITQSKIDRIIEDIKEMIDNLL